MLNEVAFGDQMLNEVNDETFNAEIQEPLKEVTVDYALTLPVTFTVDFDRNEELLEKYAVLGDALVSHTNALFITKRKQLLVDSYELLSKIVVLLVD